MCVCVPVRFLAFCCRGASEGLKDADNSEQHGESVMAAFCLIASHSFGRAVHKGESQTLYGTAHCLCECECIDTILSSFDMNITMSSFWIQEL